MIIAMTAVLLALNELFRRMLLVSFVFFILAPIALLPHWLQTGIEDWFDWVKTFSILSGVCWINLCRITSISKTLSAKVFTYLLLAGNMLEAAIVDMSSGDGSQYLNAASGLLLILSLPKIDSIQVNTESPKRDFHWRELTRTWIVAYTLWNWLFVYLNFPEASPQHAAVLGSSLIAEMFSKGTWLQARATTLACYMIFYFTFQNFEQSLLVSSDGQPWLRAALSFFVFSFICTYALKHWKTNRVALQETVKAFRVILKFKSSSADRT